MHLLQPAHPDCNSNFSNTANTIGSTIAGQIQRRYQQQGKLSRLQNTSDWTAVEWASAPDHRIHFDFGLSGVGRVRIGSGMDEEDIDQTTLSRISPRRERITPVASHPSISKAGSGGIGHHRPAAGQTISRTMMGTATRH